MIYDPNTLNPYGYELATLLGSRVARYYGQQITDGSSAPPVPTVAALAADRRTEGLPRHVVRRIGGPLRAVLTAFVGRRTLIAVWTRDSYDTLLICIFSLLGMRTLLVLHNPPKRRGRAGVTGLLDSWLSKSVKGVVVHSELLRDDLPSNVRERTHVVPIVTYRRWLASHGLEPNPVTPAGPIATRRLLFLGQIRWDKGVEVMARLLRAHRLGGASVAVVGPDPIPDSWSTAAASNNIEIRKVPPGGGFASTSDLIKELAQADLLLAPYTNATQSASIMTALAAGVGVVAYNSGAVGELLADRSLVPVGEELAFQERVVSYFASPWASIRTGLETAERTCVEAWIRAVDP